jgi:hypothetical protein
VTSDQLAAILAERVIGWRVGPKRILTGGRTWIARWRFQPLRRLEHALQLLDKANGQYTLTRAENGTYTALVTVGNRHGSATGKCEAASITVALALALGIEVPQDFA